MIRKKKKRLMFDEITCFDEKPKKHVTTKREGKEKGGKEKIISFYYVYFCLH